MFMPFKVFEQGMEQNWQLLQVKLIVIKTLLVLSSLLWAVWVCFVSSFLKFVPSWHCLWENTKSKQ